MTRPRNLLETEAVALPRHALARQELLGSARGNDLAGIHDDGIAENNRRRDNTRENLAKVYDRCAHYVVNLD